MRESFKSNHELAAEILLALAGNGVQTIILCPDAQRCWGDALSQRGAAPPSGGSLHIINAPNERSAAWMAVGAAKISHRATAVLTGLDCEVARLLPAAMDAYYSGVRVFFVTADHPRRFRGTAFPKTCEQAGVFGVYCSEQLDIDGESTRTSAPLSNSKLPSGKGPVHWNVCFEPELRELGAVLENTSPAASLSEARNPLVIVGELTRDESRTVSTVLRNWGYPVITEPASQLLTDPTLDELRIEPHDELWQESRQAGYAIDAVIRIGGVPALPFWRALEIHPEASRVPVLSISALPFSGLPRAQTLQMALGDLYRLTVPAPRFAGTDSYRAWRTSNHAHRIAPGKGEWLRALSEKIAENAFVFLGGSHTLLHWNLYSNRSGRFASRLIAGGPRFNDGSETLAVFFGMIAARSTAGNDSESWAILDLRTFVDEPVRMPVPVENWHLVIVNSQTESDTAEHWAKQAKLSYARIPEESLRDYVSKAPQSEALAQILEITASTTAQK